MENHLFYLISTGLLSIFSTIYFSSSNAQYFILRSTGNMPELYTAANGYALMLSKQNHPDHQPDITCVV
jgi:hypothetical protein